MTTRLLPRTALWSLAVVLAGCENANAPMDSTPTFQNAHRVSVEEGVFAYSRISPDGRHLAYAAEVPDTEHPGQFLRIVRVVDLETQELVFAEPGIDPYWSDDGNRLIYLSMLNPGAPSVSIRDNTTGIVSRDVAPVALGDYYSWAIRGGANTILTIKGHYFDLEGNVAALPHSSMPACDGIGVGARPLISHDGTRATVFVQDEVVVRSLEDCSLVVRTGLTGAKADFSWDGRYIAFHAPRQSEANYDVVVVDLQNSTFRVITAALAGSSFFPSWTRDGRLSFRYDGPDYRGFMFASDALSAPEYPLEMAQSAVAGDPGWNEVWPGVEAPDDNRVSLVALWAPWSPHIPEALADLELAALEVTRRQLPVDIIHAVDPASRRDDVERMLLRSRVSLPMSHIEWGQVAFTGLHNQNPAALLFRGGRLVGRRLGPLNREEILAWVSSALSSATSDQ